MNTSKYIPKECATMIYMVNEEYPEYPFFSGTGFFVKFNPFDYIYFVTAKHCILDNEENPRGTLKIKLNNYSNCKKAVPFIPSYLTTQIRGNDYFEDIIVHEVNVGELSDSDRVHLDNRALRLPHQEDVDCLIRISLKINGKVRSVGYPSPSKEMDYEKNLMIVQPRGVVGTVKSSTSDLTQVTVEELNWKEGDLNGFSGSPVLELIPREGKVEAIPIGVISTAGENKFTFISINVVTNLIACSIKSK